MSLHRPESLDEALSLLGSGAVVLAGGTDVYPGLRDGAPPASLVDLTRVAGLRGISLQDGLWRIGAATTWTDVLRAELPACFAGLKGAAREVGSVQIQNTGTVAGNICNASPAADGVPALMALDAQVEVTGSDGARRVTLEQFIRGPRSVDLRPGEIVSAVLVPEATGQGAFRKLGARKYLVISIAMVAAVVEVAGNAISRARVSVGSCSPVAVRLRGLEEALTGATVAEVPGIVAGADLPGLTPIDDVRASAAYRREAVRTLIARTITDAMEVRDVT